MPNQTKIEKNTPLHRCGWVSSDPIYLAYHDNEWGVPELDSRALFAKLCLDGQQAGLSWLTILKKQQNHNTSNPMYVHHQKRVLPYLFTYFNISYINCIRIII